MKGKIIIIKQFAFYCPGCGHKHYIAVNGGPNTWSMIGGEENPTIQPSILNYIPKKVMKDGQEVMERTGACHLFITAGSIHYCNDSVHAFAGQVVEMNWLD